MRLKIYKDIKRWTTKRKSARVVAIIQGRTTVAEASRMIRAARPRHYTYLPGDVLARAVFRKRYCQHNPREP